MSVECQPSLTSRSIVKEGFGIMSYLCIQRVKGRRCDVIFGRSLVRCVETWLIKKNWKMNRADFPAVLWTGMYVYSLAGCEAKIISFVWFLLMRILFFFWPRKMKVLALFSGLNIRLMKTDRGLTYLTWTKKCIVTKYKPHYWKKLINDHGCRSALQTSPFVIKTLIWATYKHAKKSKVYVCIKIGIKNEW